jgi:hypothetical protein
VLTSSCLRRQAYTVRHKVIKVTIEALARRVSQTGQCICTYTNENDVCQCAAKFSISAADRALAADELQRRHGITKRLPQLREQDSAPDCLAALQAEERANQGGGSWGAHRLRPRQGARSPGRAEAGRGLERRKVIWRRVQAGEAGCVNPVNAVLGGQNSNSGLRSCSNTFISLHTFIFHSSHFPG